MVMTTILCINDDLRVLETQKSFLEKNGYRVLTATDSVTGIEMTREHSVDAVVLDSDMAGMDGNEVATMLMKERPNLPVAISSGFPDGLPESLKWFADALVQKGDGPEALLLAIGKLIASSSTAKKTPSRETARTIEQLSA